MRRRHQHALFGPSGLTGLWQPEDLYSNCKSKRFLRQQQALWEIGEGADFKTRHGNLKAASMPQHAAWNAQAVQDLREFPLEIQKSFLWGGWSLPFDGSKDHMFVANRVDRHTQCEPGVHSIDKALHV